MIDVHPVFRFLLFHALMILLKGIGLAIDVIDRFYKTPLIIKK